MYPYINITAQHPTPIVSTLTLNNTANLQVKATGAAGLTDNIFIQPLAMLSLLATLLGYGYLVLAYLKKLFEDT